LKATSFVRDDLTKTSVLKGMAHVCEKRAHYHQALRLYQEVLSTRRATLGEMNELVGDVLCCTGFVYFKQKRYDDALRMYDDALDAYDHDVDGRIVVSILAQPGQHVHRAGPFGGEQIPFEGDGDYTLYVRILGERVPTSEQ